MQRKTIEFKSLMGQRQRDSDGFTYSYGKFKDSKNRNRHKNVVKASVRSDKRGVKQKENRRIQKELNN